MVVNALLVKNISHMQISSLKNKQIKVETTGARNVPQTKASSLKDNANDCVVPQGALERTWSTIANDMRLSE